MDTFVKFIDVLSSILNWLSDLGDKLDDMNSGLYDMTDGRCTTKEEFRLELFRFLAYIVAGCDTVNEGQILALNFVLDGVHDVLNVNAKSFKQVARGISASDAIPNVALAFCQEIDVARSKQNGEDEAGLTDHLVRMYKGLGQMMVAMNYTSVSNNRYDIVINLIQGEANSWTDDDDEL